MATPNHTAPAPARPSRRWHHVLATALAAVFVVLLTGFSALWWWSGTDGSLATSLRWVARYHPLNAEGVSGSLRAGGQVQTLSWQQDGLKVVATGASLAWQPLSLLSGQLQLQRLVAASVSIDDQRAASPSAGPPTSLALPFRITLDAFSVDRLQWAGPPAFDASDITGSYQFDGAQHQLTLSGAQVASGHYSGRVSLAATGTLALDAALSGTMDAAVPSSNTHMPLVVTATARGPLTELTLQAAIKLSTPAVGASPAPQASATARLTPWAAQPLPQADASFSALDLASLWPGAPQTGLTGTFSVRPDNKVHAAWQLQTSIHNSLPGPWDQQRLPLDRLQAQGEWRNGVAMVRQLQAQLGGGEVLASGQWSSATPSPDATDWQAKATLKNINPAALHTQFAALPVNGQADLSGQAGAINFDTRLTSNGAPVATAKTAVKPDTGNLRLRDASAQGRWAGDTLSLTQFQLRSDDATLAGTLELQPAVPSGKGHVTLNAPGLDAQIQGELREARGAGELNLRGRDAGQALRWLQGLPGMPASLRNASASGKVDLQLGWQGGWRDPALQAKLQVPSLDWQAGPAPKTKDASSPSPDVLKVRAVEVSVSGRLSQAELKAQGRLELAERRYALQAAASGGRIGPAKAAWSAARWQALVQQLELSVQDPALGTGVWRLASRGNVPLKWTPGASGGALEAGTGEAVLSAPARGASAGATTTPSQAVLAWQAVKWRAGELITAGTLTGLPLAWIELIAGPQLAGAGLTGNLVFDGQWDAALGETLRLKASLARSRGDLTVQAETAQGVNTPVAAGVRDARLSLLSEGEAVTVVLRWDSERAGKADGILSTRLAKRGAEGWVWPQDSPINGQLRAQLPRIGVWSVLAPPGWRLRGSLGTDVVLSGTRIAPHLSGSLQADDLALRSVVDGIEFGKGRLRATLDGTRMRISEFTLQGAGEQGAGGMLRAQGEAGWINGQPQVQLDAKLERLRASLRTDRQITLSGDIRATLANKAAAFTGQLRVDKALILLPDESTPQLGNDVIVRTTGRAASGKKAPADASAPNSEGKDGRSLKLAVQLNLGDDFRIQGKGLDTRVQGTLALQGESIDSVRLTGTVHTVNGEYRAYGQRLDVEQGVLRFTGPIDNPTLDILAIRPNLTQRVGVQITGTALLPRVRLYAEPELPDSEKLSWLVVGRASASGGAEAALLQQAAIALLGSKASGLSGGLAASLGLDELSIRGASTQADGSTSEGAVTLGKRFSRNFYAAYERSLSGALGTLYLFYDLSQRFTVRAQAGDQSAVDLIFTIPFD
ncbi:translocation/assembly module TamB domain-containing protein [Polaromonas sp. UC242_47]|uniref:translocation/assembly module TamB domain-containing protein n=1 Tax=Polaromonas sp. UC242_47 TaxID=3374626 RepID=UPI00379EC7F8